jgi:hypothetical protein
MAVADWPERTADISEIGIEVCLAPQHHWQALSELAGQPC